MNWEDTRIRGENLTPFIFKKGGYRTPFSIAEKVAQAQDAKTAKLVAEEIFEAYDDMLESMGKGKDNFKKSDWEYVQALKDRYLKEK